MHLITKRLDRLRGQLRRLLLGYALGWWVAAVVATTLLVALADYVIGFRDPGLRVMSTLSVVTVFLVLGYQLLWRSIRQRFSDVELALRVERRFPAMRDRLASAVEFVDTPDNSDTGSPELRKQVVTDVSHQFAPLDLNTVLDWRPASKALLGAAIVAAVAAALVIYDPLLASTALARLAQPLGGPAWPKANHLGLAQPVHRVALGERFEVEVVDRLDAALPAEVRIHYRFLTPSGGVSNEHVELLKLVGNRMIAAQDNVLRPFQYRVEGGDDDSMPWLDLEVIEPPAVEELTASLHYPAYTSFAVGKTDGDIRALLGTRVALQGTTNKPVKAVTLRRQGQPDISLRVGDDRQSFELLADATPGLVVTASGNYTLDLEDAEGFHGGRDRRYEIVVLPDRPPTVVIETPTADSYVTAEAAVPLRIAAKDDLALRQIVLTWQPADDPKAAVERTPLWSGPEPLPESDANVAPAPERQSQVVELRWELAPLKLKPGSSILLTAVASDYKPNETSSAARRLTIVSKDELQDRFADRQTAILNELSRVLKLQQDARQRVAGLEIQLDQANQVSKTDVDHLQQAELTQRKVQQSLGRRDAGLPAQVADLLDDLKNNKIESLDVSSRLDELMKAFDELGGNQLPAIAGELTTALKELQSQPTSSDKPAANSDKSNPANPPPKSSANQQSPTGNEASAGKESQSGKESPAAKPSSPPAKQAPSAARHALAEAGQNQDETIDALEKLLSELSEWDNYRRFHREVGQLRRQQEELARDTADLGKSTLGNDMKDLKPQQQADLKKLGTRQMGLARNLEKLQQSMEQMAQQLRETDPLAAATLDDALHQARQQQLAGQMRDAARQTEQNQTGQAAKAQAQAQRGLDEMLDVLANRRERELGRLVAKLREAEKDLASLREQQEGLRRKLADAAKIADPKERERQLQQLTRQQRQLQQETERMVRSLQRLQSDRASRSASRASSRMAQAGGQGEQGNAGQAAEEAEGAEKDLADAQRQLAQQRRQAEADLANEQLAQMHDNLQGMRRQQAKLLDETQHYDKLAQDEGGLKRSQWQSLRELARAQRALAGEASGMAERLSGGAPGFDLALRNAGRHMTRAADRLDERQPDGATQRAQRDADRQLAMILDALKNSSEPGKEQKSGEGGGEGGGESSNKPAVDVAELKLLKLMQEDVNARVKQLAEATAGRPLDDAQRDEFNELSRQQGKLADLLIDLTKVAAEQASDVDEELKKLLEPAGKPGEKQP